MLPAAVIDSEFNVGTWHEHDSAAEDLLGADGIDVEASVELELLGWGSRLLSVQRSGCLEDEPSTVPRGSSSSARAMGGRARARQPTARSRPSPSMLSVDASRQAELDVRHDGQVDRRAVRRAQLQALGRLSGQDQINVAACEVAAGVFHDVLARQRVRSGAGGPRRPLGLESVACAQGQGDGRVLCVTLFGTRRPLVRA